MPAAAAILARLDVILREVTALRDEVAASLPAPAAEGADEAEADDWLEISTAVERFNRPADSLRWLCRKQACGRKIGGRWQISARRTERWLNGGG